MKPSKQCYDLIKSFEGLSLTAYKDPGSRDGKPITIGWGTTTYNTAGYIEYGRSEVVLGDVLKIQECESEFKFDVDSVAKEVDDLNVNLNQKQFDAAVSFHFNVGFPQQQVDRLKAGRLKEYANAMLLYINGKDGPLPGLVTRRKQEFDLFNKPVSAEVDMSDFVSAYWYLINKNGLWKMNGSVCVEKVRDFPSVQPISSNNLVPSNIIVNFDAKDPTVVTTGTVKLDTVFVTKENGNWSSGPWRGLAIININVGGKLFRGVSGLLGVQNFRKGGEGIPGSGEPVEQGTYVPSDIIWKNGKDNYNDLWSEGLGAWVIDLIPQFQTKRSAIEFHADHNLSTSPGTMGCIGIDPGGQKEFIAAWRKVNPKKVVVDWGL